MNASPGTAPEGAEETGMTPEELEETVVATIQETQVKLGSAAGAECLYLPLDSVAPGGDPAEAAAVARAFAESARPRLGDVVCEVLEGRLRITVPEEGGRYVAGLPVSPVLRLMVDAVTGGYTVEALRAELDARFPGHVWRDADGDGGFDYVVYFEDGTDASVYCIGVECCRLTYHRFSRRDYDAFGFGALRRGVPPYPLIYGARTRVHEAHHLHGQGGRGEDLHLGRHGVQAL